MHGYSVNWGHKIPQITITKKPVIVHNVISSLQSISVKEMSTVNLHDVKWNVTARIKTINSFHSKKINSNRVTSSPMISAPTKLEKGQPQFFTGDEQENDHAKKSLVFGILSLASPAVTFLIMFGIVLSVGGTLAKPATYAAVIFALGCAGGLVFAMIAIINGFIAIHEINAAPDTYVGKGDALLGIIFGALVSIGMAAYLLVRFGLKK